jgi:hypothetical protein
LQQGATIISAPSPTLAPALLDAAHTLLGLAHSCLYRSQVIATAACPAAATAAAAAAAQLQQLAAAAATGPLAAAQQQLAAVGAQLLSPAGLQRGLGGEAGAAKPQGLELRAALAAEAAVVALQRAAAVEGVAAVVALRLHEVSCFPFYILPLFVPVALGSGCRFEVCPCCIAASGKHWAVAVAVAVTVAAASLSVPSRVLQHLQL